MTSREISEAFMPSVPMVIPSEIVTVLNSIGVPPASRMPCFTASDTWYHSGAEWHLNAIKGAQPLSEYIGQMDSTTLHQMIDTLYNTGVKAQNKDLDIDVKRQ